MNAKKIKHFLAHYLFGLFSKSFTGGIVAVDAFIGLAVGSAATTDIAKPNWQAAAAVFGVSFVRSALAYFRDNPLPTELPDDCPPKPVATPQPPSA